MTGDGSKVGPRHSRGMGDTVGEATAAVPPTHGTRREEMKINEAATAPKTRGCCFLLYIMCI